MKRILAFSLVTMLVGQTWASDLHSVITASQPAKSGKVKETVVEYPKNDYVIECLCQKKTIATQHQITIRKLSDGEMIIEGVVHNANPNLEVSGTWNNERGKIKGIFVVANTEEYTFTLNPKKSSALSVDVINIDSYSTVYNNHSVLIDKKVGSQIEYTLTLEDLSNRAKYKLVLNKGAVLQYYNDLSKLLVMAEKVDIQYSNGDSFNGRFTVDNGIIMPQMGEYRYKNGDVFIGNVAGDKYCNTYIDGTTIFWKNGEKKNGNWLEPYKLTSTQLNEIAQLATPSEKAIKASEYKSVNFKRYIENGDYAMKNGKLDDAKRWYQLAQTIRPDSEILIEKFKTLDNAHKEKERYNNLISRFGWDNGTKLADGKLQIGMTKEMCYAIDISDADYKITRHKERNGDIIEEWVIDFGNLRNEIDDVLGLGPGLAPDDALAEQFVDFTYAFAESFAQAFTATSGIQLSNNQIVNNRFKYKYIKFKNNVIIELRKSGAY